MSESGYVHTVFFTLHPDTPAEKIDAQIADGQTLLGQIPTVRSLRTGPRPRAIARDVHDQDFEIGLFVAFDDQAGCRTYLDHPRHLDYVARNKAGWANVRVCDFTA